MTFEQKLREASQKYGIPEAEIREQVEHMLHGGLGEGIQNEGTAGAAVETDDPRKEALELWLTLQEVS